MTSKEIARRMKASRVGDTLPDGTKTVASKCSVCRERYTVDRFCDYDEAFTRQEMFEETGLCLRCKANPKCPMHIKAIEEEYGIKVERG